VTTPIDLEIPVITETTAGLLFLFKEEEIVLKNNHIPTLMDGNIFSIPSEKMHYLLLTRHLLLIFL
jgi:tmRNA-binding protein